MLRYIHFKIDNDDEPIQVEKSQAVHGLVESHKQAAMNSFDERGNEKDLLTPYVSYIY